jgi:hypothetical protein
MSKNSTNKIVTKSASKKLAKSASTNVAKSAKSAKLTKLSEFYGKDETLEVENRKSSKGKEEESDSDKASNSNSEDKFTNDYNRNEVRFTLREDEEGKGMQNESEEEGREYNAQFFENYELENDPNYIQTKPTINCNNPKNYIYYFDYNTYFSMKNEILEEKYNVKCENINVVNKKNNLIFYDRLHSILCICSNNQFNVNEENTKIIKRYFVKMENGDEFYLYNKVTDGLFWFYPKENSIILRVKIDSGTKEYTLYKEKIISVEEKKVKKILSIQNFPPGLILNAFVSGPIDVFNNEM